MVQKRGGLRWRSVERFDLDQLRGVLGVPRGKLTSWSNFKLRALDPAMAEVNALSDYIVAFEPIRTGRSVTHVDLRWWRKDGAATDAADRALQFSRIGRQVRAQGRAEQPVGEGVSDHVPRGLQRKERHSGPRPTRRPGCVIRASTSIR